MLVEKECVVDTSTNTLLNGRLKILQPLSGYRVAVDPVLLASAVPASSGQCVADFGCGTGAAALCLLRREAMLRCVGIELNPRHVELSRQSAQLNQMADRLHLIDGDIRRASEIDGGMAFDGVMMNPPYFVEGNVSPQPGRGRAHHEADTSVSDWIRAAAECLKPKGHLTVIQAADRLQDILIALGRVFGAVEIIPLWSKPGRDAKRVIIRAVKGRKTPLRILPGLILHGEDGVYTAAAQAILRDGMSLDDAMPLQSGKAD